MEAFSCDAIVYTHTRLIFVDILLCSDILMHCACSTRYYLHRSGTVWRHQRIWRWTGRCSMRDGRVHRDQVHLHWWTLISYVLILVLLIIYCKGTSGERKCVERSHAKQPHHASAGGVQLRACVPSGLQRCLDLRNSFSLNHFRI